MEPITAYRVSAVRESTHPNPLPSSKITGPAAVARLVSALVPEGDERERFIAVYLDEQNHIKGTATVSVGLLNASLVHPREVFRCAILLGASHVIVAHNHPSGDPEPSVEDLTVTKQLMEAGKVLGLPVRDHVVVGDAGRYVSLAERGVAAMPGSGAQALHT